MLYVLGISMLRVRAFSSIVETLGKDTYKYYAMLRMGCK